MVSNFFFSPLVIKKEKGILFIKHIAMTVLEWVGIREGTYFKDEEQHSGFPKVLQVLCFALFEADNGSVLMGLFSFAYAVIFVRWFNLSVIKNSVIIYSHLYLSSSFSHIIFSSPEYDR